ncbi:Zinc finger, RING-type [Sesbania bispinosa]|nr:Zinc finger, RING-type [Sesbania bispinosa]
MRCVQGTSENPVSGGSTPSQSESSEFESTTKSHLSLQKSFSNHHSFSSKPIHPLSFPDLTPTRETFEPAVVDFSVFDASNPLRDTQHLSSASSSLDSACVSELFESEISSRSHIPSNESRCSLCERFLSYRSPCSSRRIVRSGDMPITGVLPCCHVFHAECLEQATPKAQKNDPPCPLCIKLERGNSPDHQGLSRLRNGFPMLRPFYEDGPSRSWGYAQVGECVEGALQAPPGNAMFLFSRNHSKRIFL